MIFNISLDQTRALPEEACFRQKALGVYCLFVFVASLILNTSLLITFYSYKNLRTAYNIYIIALTSVNLFSTVTVLPLVMVSNFYCKWIFGKLGCSAYAFLIFWTGGMSIYILTVLSHGHFVSLSNHLMGHSPPSFRQSYIKIIVCGLLSFIWAIMPVFGWSEYTLEGIGTSCGIEWNRSSRNVLSFNITVLITVFFIPIISMVVSNYRIIKLVKHLQKYQRIYMNMKSLKLRISIERSLTIVTITLIICFLITWSPYAFVSVYRLLIDDKGVDPFFGSLPGMFAKSSLLWSTLFYILIYKQIRHKFLRILCRCQKETPCTKQEPETTTKRTNKNLNPTDV